MDHLFLENVHKAQKDYPYINLVNLNLNYSVHYHSEIEVVYVVYGKTTISINGRERELSQGDICIVMPGEIHSFSSNISNHVYIMKFFSFGELRFLKIDNVISDASEYYPLFKKIIDNIALEDTKREDGYNQAVNMYANELALQIIRVLKPEKISEESKKNEIKYLNFLSDINDFLESNFSEKITLSDISSHLGYSKFYFSHLFKEITKQNFLEFLIAFRMEKALSMLADGNKVTKVAVDCGFGSLRNFNMHFKNLYNTTPKTIKNMLR